MGVTLTENKLNSCIDWSAFRRMAKTMHHQYDKWQSLDVIYLDPQLPQRTQWQHADGDQHQQPLASLHNTFPEATTDSHCISIPIEGIWRSSRETSNNSEIWSSACSHSVQPSIAQLYALRYNHEISFAIIVISFWRRAVSTIAFAVLTQLVFMPGELTPSPARNCWISVSISAVLWSAQSMRKFPPQKRIPYLSAPGSTRSFRMNRMIHRINVIPSASVTPLSPIVKILRGALRTVRRSVFMSFSCESCVASYSILRSKSGAFTISPTARIAVIVSKIGPLVD